jgi:hypothetical protein
MENSSLKIADGTDSFLPSKMS